eukprot:symbB.v1.2.027430.t1/scaffold2809.1/size69810/5
MESLFYQYGVDLVFNGHVHSYERSFPVYNNSVNECGTVHLVVGDGGNYEGPAIYEGHPSGWRQPQPEWSAFREASYGPGLLTVYNSTHAEWRWHRVACVFQNQHHEAVKLSKFTYDGSRQSLGRTRPMSAYYWDGISGPAEGPKCTTQGDNSKQAFAASDLVMLVRNPERCANKRDDKQRHGSVPTTHAEGFGGPVELWAMPRTDHLVYLLSAALVAFVILRDLKPDNVLYATKAPDSAVKVIDFGLADFLQRLRQMAGGKAMERAGTLAFMAPEMLSSTGDGSYGEKVDVWAIGCIMYLLITGEHPFWSGRGTSEEQLVNGITKGQLPPHPNFAAAPAAARELAMQLMVKDPLRRASAADALRHPWLKHLDQAPSKQVLDKSVFEALCKYQASSKLKRAVLKLLAKEADEERVKRLREQFRLLDAHQDGFISRDELVHGMRQCPEFSNVTVTSSDLARILPPELFAEKISCTDFTAALLSLQGFRKAELLAAFHRFDVRREGKISLSALSDVLKNAGPASKLEAFREADVGQDGAIDFDEFCALINA